MIAKPDERNVHVPISHRLIADLHEADHRDERSEKPKPADAEIGASATSKARWRSSPAACQRCEAVVAGQGRRIG